MSGKLSTSDIEADRPSHSGAASLQGSGGGDRAWLAFLAMGSLAIVGYFLLPKGILQNLWYDSVGIFSVAAVLVGARRRPAGVVSWYMLAAGISVFVVGDAIQGLYEVAFDIAVPFPSVADAFYLAGYPIIALGLVVMVRRRSSGYDRASVLDTAIVAIGCGVLAWTFLASPYALDSSIPIFERVVSIAYPMADVLLLAVVARLVFAPDGGVFAGYALMLALSVLLVSDAVCANAALAGNYSTEDLMNVGWLTSYLLFGVAALHPSMTELTQITRGGSTAFSRARVTALILTALALPAVSLIRGDTGEYVSTVIVMLGTIVLFLLVLLRMEDLLRSREAVSLRYERAAEREKILRQAGARLVKSLDRAEIYQTALDAALELAAKTNGIQIIVAVRKDEGFSIVAVGERAAGLKDSTIDVRRLPEILRPGFAGTRLVEAHGSKARGASEAMGLGSEFSTVLVTPFVVGEDSVGALVAMAHATFDEEVRIGLDTLSNQVSLALESADLNEHLLENKSQERSRALIKNSSDMVTVLDSDGRVSYQSPSMERVLGHDSGSRVGKSLLVSELVHPDDLAVQSEAFFRAVANPGETATADFRMRHADGEWRSMEGSFRSLLDDPDVGGVVVNTRNVTERREAERKLGETEERYRTLVERLPAVLYTQGYDENGSYSTYISPYMKTMLGYDPEECESDPQHWRNILHPDDYERVMSEDLRTNRTLEPFVMEYRQLHKDGRVVWIRDEAVPVFGSDGTPTHWQGFQFDITERKLAEARIAEAEEKYRGFIEQIPVVTYLQEVDHHHGSTIFVSPQIEELLGYTPQEYVSDHDLWKRILHPDDHDRVIAEDERTDPTGEPYKIEYRMIHRDGHSVWVRDEAVIVRDASGGSSFWQGIFKDITEQREAEKALRGAEEQYRTLVEQNPAAIYVDSLDDSNSPIYVSPRIEELLGYSIETWLTVPDLFEHILYSEDREWVLEEHSLANASENSFTLEYRVCHSNGRVVWLRDESFVSRAGLGGTAARQGFLVDITERKLAEERLQRSERRLASAQRIARLGNWHYDVDEDNARWSEEIYSICGLSPDDFSPTYKSFLDVVHPEDRGTVRRIARQALYEKKRSSADYRILRPDGETRHVHTEYEVVEADGKVKRMVGILQDVTERRKLEEQLEHQAFHDSLTNLPNRTLLMDRLTQALARRSRKHETVAILFVDLDDFKNINDSLGHGAGDRLLIEVSERLSTCVRESDTVSRLGGDEFAILVEDFDNRSEVPGGVPERVAEQVLEVFGDPFMLADREVVVRPSIGISVRSSSEPGGKGLNAAVQADEMLRDADVVMYAAKDHGKARYEFYNPRMHASALERLDLRADLRRALDEDEFVVYYQPIFDLGGELRELEALVRWRHPDNGLVPSGEFIPLAEETGLIVEIGHRVLEKSCRQVSDWNALRGGGPLTLSVNLSGRQFHQEDLAGQVSAALENSGLDADNLKLEITESAAMRDVETALLTLRTLKVLGVRIAIDDFGTGYSSLSYLHRFPVDTLKIDRSFVGRLEEDPESSAIVSTTVALARTLGLSVTAEGVETIGQLRKIRELGCDLAQGFYFARPMASEDLPALVFSE